MDGQDKRVMGYFHIGGGPRGGGVVVCVWDNQGRSPAPPGPLANGRKTRLGGVSPTVVSDETTGSGRKSMSCDTYRSLRTTSV